MGRGVNERWGWGVYKLPLFSRSVNHLKLSIWAIIKNKIFANLVWEIMCNIFVGPEYFALIWGLGSVIYWEEDVGTIFVHNYWFRWV